MGDKIYIQDDNGKSIECDIIFTFDNKDTNKSYIIYTDNTYDELGNIKIYANTYDAYSDDGVLGSIDSDSEWALIEQIMSSISDNKEE